MKYFKIFKYLGSWISNRNGKNKLKQKNKQKLFRRRNLFLLLLL